MNRAESLEYIKSIEAFLGQDPLTKTEPLNAGDAALIGHLIQAFNFIEYNLRRAIEVFSHAGLIPRPRKNPRPPELVKLVKAGVAKLNQDAEAADIICKTLDDIEMHRDIRNHLAHWAAKRIKGHDALYLLSLDAMDATRRVGSAVDHNTSVFCILNLADIRGLLLHISEQEKWLAKLSAKWFVDHALAHQNPQAN